MTELKKLSYKLEDTFALGKSLPVVAMRQLPRIADAFAVLPDDQEYIAGTQQALARHVRCFVAEHIGMMDDERELKRVFADACKKASYGPRYLELFKS